MLGINLFYIDVPTLECLIRKVYHAISLKSDNKIKLKCLEDIKPAFTNFDYNKVIKN